MSNEEEENQEEIFKEFEKEKKFQIIDNLGKGGFGLVKEIKFKGKIFAAKLVDKLGDTLNKNSKNLDYIDETDNILEFRGPGIVKVNSIFSYSKEDIIYHLILMEEAAYGSLYDFNKSLKKENYLGLIVKKPFELMGDNLLKYFLYSIIQGYEILKRNNFCHFDIKPKNILLFLNMVAKLTDFSFVTKIEENTKDVTIKMPGKTNGYASPEYYQNESIINIKDAFKQDYFALGSTIFYLKYGEKLLSYKEYEDDIITSDLIIDLLQKGRDKIRSKKEADQDFIEFLCNLIQYKPEDRPTLEEIIRNKWLNKNKEEIYIISKINDRDDKTLVKELDKSDFLIRKRDNIRDEKKVVKNKINKNNKPNRNKFIFRYKNKVY